MKLPKIPTNREEFNMKEWLEAIPKLYALYDTPQDKTWHAEGNVGIHTEMVVKCLLDDPDYLKTDETRKQRLFLGALLHDIGKPLCTKEEDGKITSKGHSKIGTYDARKILWQFGVDFKQREQICKLIEYHQEPFFVIKSDKAEYKIRKMASELDLRDLETMSRADNKGRISPNYQETVDHIDLFVEMSKELNVYGQKPEFFDNDTRVQYYQSEGKIWPHSKFYTDAGSDVIFMSGLPASGKNTWVEKNGKGLPVISFDDEMEELGVKPGDKAAGKAIHSAIDKAKELLREKKPFIWNATNVSALNRKKALDLLHNYSAQIHCVYIEVSEKTLRERNNKRDSTVTNAVIDKMMQKWEIPQENEVHSIEYVIETPKIKKNFEIPEIYV